MSIISRAAIIKSSSTIIFQPADPAVPVHCHNVIMAIIIKINEIRSVIAVCFTCLGIFKNGCKCPVSRVGNGCAAVFKTINSAWECIENEMIHNDYVQMSISVQIFHYGFIRKTKSIGYNRLCPGIFVDPVPGKKHDLSVSSKQIRIRTDTRGYYYF